jgi:hypothetical protein
MAIASAKEVSIRVGVLVIGITDRWHKMDEDGHR